VTSCAVTASKFVPNAQIWHARSDQPEESLYQSVAEAGSRMSSARIPAPELMSLPKRCRGWVSGLSWDWFSGRALSDLSTGSALSGSGAAFSVLALSGSCWALGTRYWLFWWVLCMGRSVARLCCMVVWRVQRVTAVRVAFDMPFVVMDLVVAVPAHHDQILQTGGTTL